MALSASSPSSAGAATVRRSWAEWAETEPDSMEEEYEAWTARSPESEAPGWPKEIFRFFSTANKKDTHPTINFSHAPRPRVR
eukprot:1918967-Lingulodinium_polyedra.AAC.1